MNSTVINNRTVGSTISLRNPPIAKKGAENAIALLTTISAKAVDIRFQALNVPVMRAIPKT